MEPLCNHGVCPPFRTTAKEKVAAFFFGKVTAEVAQQSDSSIT